MYEQLSHGVTSYSSERIQKEQLYLAAAAWARGETPVYDLDPKAVTTGHLHDWQDRLLVSVKMTYPPEMVEEIRTARERVHQDVVEFFEVCRATPEREFDYWFNRERNAGPRAIAEAYRAWQQRGAQTAGLAWLRVIQNALRNNGVSGAGWRRASMPSSM
jgi:hypothetical protein